MSRSKSTLALLRGALAGAYHEQMGGRSQLTVLVLAALGCVAEAAEPQLAGEDAHGQPGPRTGVDEIDEGPVAMAEFAVGEQPLEPAREPVAPFAPDWRMPAHDPGELPRWVRHQTIPRESVEQLAGRYGVDAARIREWNGLDPDAQPHPRQAQTLRIYATRNPPPRERIEHVVVAGEGWGSIARRYGVDSSQLRAWNVSETGRTLEPEERLVIWIDPVVFQSIIEDHPRTARAALIRPGAHGVGTAQAGILVAGVQIPPGPGYELRYPNSAWGTTAAVRETVAALDRFVARSDYPLPIRVGTMSRQRGGEIGGHHSHQTGRDLDVRLPLRPEVPQALKPTPRRVDWLATWELVEAFAASERVEVIFLDYGGQRRLAKAAEAAGVSQERRAALLQYPRGSMANLGLVRHSPGHEAHIHVRFECGEGEPECW